LLLSDVQLKDLKQAEIAEVFFSLKELIIFVYDNEVRSGKSVVLKRNTQLQAVLSELDREIELLYLNFCYQLLKASGQIQQRFLALILIEEKLEAVLPRLRSFYTSKSSSTSAIPASRGNNVQSKSYLNSKIVEDWIRHSNIIEYLFGESFHQDLASRSDAVIIFMAIQGILTIEHLKVIPYRYTATRIYMIICSNLIPAPIIATDYLVSCNDCSRSCLTNIT